VDVLAGPDRGVREDEADGVVDPAGRHLVGVEEEGRDREAGGVGARALLAPAARRVDPRHVPDGQAAPPEDLAADVGPPHLEELHPRPVDDDEVAVAVAPALVAVFPLEGAAGRDGHGVEVAVRAEVVLGRGEGAQRRAGRRLQDLDREVDLHPAEAPADAVEIRDDGGGLGIQGGRGHVPVPDGLGREVGGRRPRSDRRGRG
jgi:hypothetical protein